MLTASPEGLSDAALARELGDGIRPQTVNQLCRRMAAEGELERVGTRPIINRLPAATRSRRTRSTSDRTTRAARAAPVAAAPPPEHDASESEASAAPGPVPAEPAARTKRTGRTARTPRRKTEPTVAVEQDAPETEASVATEAAQNASGAGNGTSSVTGSAPVDDTTAAEGEPAGVGAAEAAGSTCGPPPYDALQAWSRVVNVQALVAEWLVRRGATLRWASVDAGPARDLVASLDGDDVHVEVTGWPADGARTHPTTIAGDWFSAAEHAAAERRRAHPRARIVIALPDTRRYRSLTEQRAAALAGTRAEVWFVDPAGAVHAR
jgi:hypothetical protein